MKDLLVRVGVVVSMTFILSSGSASAQVCGNGSVEAPETCDPPGSTLTTCTPAIDLTCQPDCTLPACPQTCGNGVVEPPEVCDPPGSTITACDPPIEVVCQSDCTLTCPPPSCGNGTVEQPEACDPPGSTVMMCTPTVELTCGIDCTLPPCTNMDGDPHLRTIDGTRYDFQGAGEFVALQAPGANGAVVQVRQSPVATGALPGADPYSGLRVCVSVNTAVAARVGRHRVSYQPSGGVQPSENELQLRVDGKVVKLETGIDLGAGARILPTNVPGGLSIEFPDKSVLVVTPGWWAPYKQWYLNLSFASSTAKMGLLGAIAKGNWLPALPQGKTLGAMPETAEARYDALYRVFADAWRVTDTTSLFDYAPGTTTATFTMKDWPTMGPTCNVEGQQPAQPATEEAAREACKQVDGANANCVFDVMATGHLGFATTYLQAQQARVAVTTKPGGGKTGDEGSRKLLLIALGIAIAVLVILIVLLVIRRK